MSPCGEEADRQSRQSSLRYAVIPRPAMTRERQGARHRDPTRRQGGAQIGPVPRPARASAWAAPQPMAMASAAEGR